MRKMTKKNKVLAAAGALALVAGGGGAAYAYWTTTGDGSGSAANSNGGGTVALTAQFSQGLTPGNSVPVEYYAENETASGTRVFSVSPTVSITLAAGVTGTCDTTWFTPTAPVVAGGVAVAAGATALVSTGDLTFADSATVDQSACKGATVTLTLESDK
ncbi:hypothetical protein AU252_14120 [Pseudarthrobacter sulfonivorans]|uniref:SipW-cognate class signal peptide n=1 Tax=Pseudarthrobacter sulfonivorans TaxID=121292 RepID=A0A0U3PCQ5_9MICC|nr:hypothetical protein [Pseudarthrobacter sulfonivorans]ALV42147.1 hypothetical protein AU252_14120 [Pseudarthrobacter sulfonivorans]